VSAIFCAFECSFELPTKEEVWYTHRPVRLSLPLPHPFSFKWIFNRVNDRSQMLYCLLLKCEVSFTLSLIFFCKSLAPINLLFQMFWLCRIFWTVVLIFFSKCCNCRSLPEQTDHASTGVYGRNANGPCSTHWKGHRQRQHGVLCGQQEDGPCTINCGREPHLLWREKGIDVLRDVRLLYAGVCEREPRDGRKEIRSGIKN
jgi:hypothetical protein